MTKIIGTLLILSLMIGGCSSAQPEKTNYYLLSQSSEKLLTSDKNMSSADETSKKRIVLAKIYLAEFLSQPSLVMKLDQHQLHYARFHQWAEGLQDGITKALLHDLNAAQSDYRFVDIHQAVKPFQSLLIQIDHFYPDERSYVVLSGSYWLNDSDKQLLTSARTFKFELPLEKDGYAFAVSQMRELITNLAAQLAKEIK